MSLHRRSVWLVGLCAALSFGFLLATSALAGGSACGSKKAQAACPSAGKGCAAAAMGSCGAKAAPTQAASGCCASKNAAAMQAASVVLPKGTDVTRVDVEGGIDLVFAGKDLDGIEKFLNAHLAACVDPAQGKKTCGQTCTMARGEKNIVLSIRGKEAESCCATWMQQASLIDEAKPGAVPAAGSKQTGLRAVKKS